MELDEPLVDGEGEGEDDPHHQDMINELDALLEMHKEPVAVDALDDNLLNEDFNKSEVVIDSELGGDEQPQDTFHEMEDE